MPSFFGITYKGDAEVAARRCVKIKVVNMFWDLAVNNPLAAIEKNSLEYSAQAVLPEFVEEHLKPEDKQVLSTGKGCAICPAEIRESGGFTGITLWDYLQWGGRRDYSRPACFANYVYGGYLWALQLIDSNKHSFPKKTVQEMHRRLRDAHLAANEQRMVKYDVLLCHRCRMPYEGKRCRCDDE